MAITARAGSSDYKPAPAGAHAAICVDVVDLGVLEVTYSGKTKSQHKVNIVWQIDELRDDGKQFELRKRYTLSLHEKAALRKDLESWRGRPFTKEELDGFDLEVLLAKPCLLNVIHNQTQNGTWANVSAIMRLPKGMVAPASRDYIRVCDRQMDSNGAPAVADGGGWEDVPPPGFDDDIPF